MSSAPPGAEGNTPIPLPVDTSSVPVLSERIRLTYLAEGAANVIYRLSAAPGENLPEEFVDKLVRLRKALPSAQPNLLAYSHLVHIFHPLFPPSLLVPTSLIRVPKSIITRETANLRALEDAGKRALKRRGLYLEESEEYGFVILDMSPHPIDSGSSLLPTTPEEEAAAARSTQPKTRQILVEFKPKWVVQSPSAPATWRRCRTCALRLSKSSSGKPNLCPLDLASQSRDRVRHTMQYILPSSPSPPKNLYLRHGENWQEAKRLIEHHVVEFLVASELMPLLKRLQSELDPIGPSHCEHGSADEKEKFVMAMTLRDLTVFLRIDLDGAVEARIGDLDLKTGEAGKWTYWGAVERKLVEVS